MSSEFYFHQWAERGQSDVSFRHFIQAQAEKYPFCAPLQLVHYAFTDEHQPDHAIAARKAALFCNHPYELEAYRWQILHRGNTEQKVEIINSVPPLNGVNTQNEASNEILPVIEPAPESTNQTPEIQSEEDKSQVSDLLFEPLHTTDYFASQGIKLSETTMGNDQLGRQLKSFTEWLKTMKKVHLQKNTDDSVIVVDPSVEKMAEKSNIESEVVTEAMAEVCIQQGKKDKAIEIYEKLSLQNPSKNLYFAQKIEQLKA